MKKENKNDNKGITILIVCIVVALAIIVGCLFFADEFFGLFIK